MTIRIPDDLARDLEGIAAIQKKSVQDLALERLRALVEKPTSPELLGRAIRALPRPSSAAVDELETAIAESRQAVNDRGVFDR